MNHRSTSYKLPLGFQCPLPSFIQLFNTVCCDMLLADMVSLRVFASPKSPAHQFMKSPVYFPNPVRLRTVHCLQVLLPPGVVLLPTSFGATFRRTTPRVASQGAWRHDVVDRLSGGFAAWPRGRNGRQRPPETGPTEARKGFTKAIHGTGKFGSHGAESNFKQSVV